MGYKRILLASLALFALAFHPSFGSSLSRQEQQQPARKRIGIVPADRHCQPAEVKFIAMGGQPAGLLLAQVTIENRSSKTLTAVKLGWKVYNQGTKFTFRPCEAPMVAAAALQAGTTPLIQVGSLAPGETCNIGTNPLKVPTPATKTVVTEQPFLTMADIESLTEDGTMHTLKGDYLILISVAEADYEDGPTWVAEKD